MVVSARTLSQQPPARTGGRDRRIGALEDEAKSGLGQRLKRIRLEKDLTIQSVSEAANVARSTISKIENGQLSPTFDLLQRLAIGLEIDLADLFSGGQDSAPAGRRSVTRAGEGHLIETKEYLYEALATDLRNKKIFPLKARIRARNLEEFGGWIRHEGEEMLIVASGEVCFYTEFYEPTILKAGDSIYIDSKMGHACVSTSDEDAEVLWVCTQIAMDV